MKKEELEVSVIPLTRLQYFPIMMFAIVMGMSGFTLIYQKSNFGIPVIVSEILMFVTVLLFISISFIYLLKTVRYLDEVIKEFHHPVRNNFFAAISVSFLLVSMTLVGKFNNIAQYLFYIGAVLHIILTFSTLKMWAKNSFHKKHLNPAWFIPIVGNVLVPVAGIKFMEKNLLMFYFSIGIFFWLILTTILINRIIFHDRLAEKFLPTFFILIAPPALTMTAYVKLTGHYDFFASTLYNITLFFTFLLFFMYKDFIKIKFFISWWAFTFPLSAVTLSSILSYHKTHYIYYHYLSMLFFGVTTIVILLVSFQTIKHIIKGEICIDE